MADPKLNKVVEDGFSKIAHSIRRVGALHVAMSITPPDSTVEEMLAMADRLSTWVGSPAGDRPRQASGGAPLGVAWEDREDL